MAERRPPCRWCGYPGVGRRECANCGMKADGEFLRKKWSIPVEMNRYNWEGSWWELPTIFPCSLSDLRGYVIFDSEEDLWSSEFFNVQLRESGKGGGIVTPRAGVSVSNIQDYTLAYALDVIDDSEYDEADEPANNNGWAAEAFVSEFLDQKGWETQLVGHLQRGYDVYAKKENSELLVEVKSSVGQISPSFTDNEIQTWLDNHDKYVVALIENFNPNWENEIVWVNRITEIYPKLITSSVTYHRMNRSVWSEFACQEDEVPL